MKKVVTVIGITLGVASLGCAILFGVKYNVARSEKEILVKQNGDMQLAIDAIGPTSTVWTVKADVKAGAEIKSDDLIEQTIPTASVNDTYILDKEKLVGCYYKVETKPGTSLTSTIIMRDEMPETTYERDINFATSPIGIEKGDFVDIRMMLPYGEELIIIEHERVEQVIKNTMKFRFDESQLATWTSAITDYALFKSKGLMIYVTKYVEPGVHEAAVPFYPVRKEAESTVTLNPNIKDKKRCINTKLRAEIDRKIGSVKEKDEGVLQSGRETEASELNAAREVYIAAQGEEGVTTEGNTGEGQNTEVVNESIGDLGEVNETVKKDAEGNTSSVVAGDKDKADGEEVYGDEESIE